MAEIIPFSSRQAFGRVKPPAGRSAEILRTVGGKNNPQLLASESPIVLVAEDKKGGGKRIVDRFTSIKEANEARRRWQSKQPGYIFLVELDPNRPGA